MTRSMSRTSTRSSADLWSRAFARRRSCQPAQRRAEEVLNDYPPEERRDRKVFWEQVLTEYYALDYRLRAALLKAFVEA